MKIEVADAFYLFFMPYFIGIFKKYGI